MVTVTINLDGVAALWIVLAICGVRSRRVAIELFRRVRAVLRQRSVR